MKIKIIQIAFYFTFMAAIVTGGKYLVETRNATTAATDATTATTAATDATTATTAAPPSNDYKNYYKPRMAGTGFWDKVPINLYPQRYRYRG